MFRLYALFLLLDLAVLVVALIDCLSSDESEIRSLPRVFWVLLILLFSPIGGIAWFVAGRPLRTVPKAKTWKPGSGFPEVERPRRAPDDDPEFLRGIAKARSEDDTLMKRWEEDLRRREEELRGKSGGNGRGDGGDGEGDGTPKPADGRTP